MRNVFFSLVSLLLASCASPSSTKSEVASLHPLLAPIPVHWKQTSSFSFTLGETITLAITPLPFRPLDERVPVENHLEAVMAPFAHAERWAERIEQEGYFGVFFEGKKAEQTTLAWAMQLDEELFHEALYQHKETPHLQALLADYTISATGSPQEIEAHRAEIIAFVKSLRPSPSIF